MVSSSCCDVVVVAETVVDEGNKVMERACEAYKSVGDREVCCLGKIVICNVVAFHFPWCPHAIFVGGRECNALSGCPGAGGRGGGADGWWGGA